MDDDLTILINGERSELVSVHDRGFMYGDGVFETLRFSRQRPLLWKQHMERLHEGLRRLGIHGVDVAVLERESQTAIQSSQLETGTLKIVITSGPGKRGYARPLEAKPTRVVSVYPHNSWPESVCKSGARLIYCETRLSINPLLAGIKHLNRLEQVLARIELGADNIDEGLMLDSGGDIIGGTMSNVFITRGNELITPDVSGCGIKGVVRDVLLDIAGDAGLAARVDRILPDDLEAADECFISNSLIGICPVKRIADIPFSPGPHSHALMKHFREYEQSG